MPFTNKIQDRLNKMVFTKRYILYNDRIVDISQPCLSPLDRGFLLGDGIFETMRAYNGHLPFWDLHMERLKNGMIELGFSLEGIDFDQMEDKANALLEKNVLSNAYVRLTISRGVLQSELLPEWGKGDPNWIIFTKPLLEQAEVNRKKGIKAIISYIRKNSTSPTIRIKTINYLDMILAKRRAMLEDSHEAIILDEKGRVTETTTSNLFWVQDGIIYTPSLDLPILPGITRRKVLEIARDLGIPCREGFYRPEALLESKESFVTNSLCEVTPLIMVNKQKIGNGNPGPITKSLQKTYKKIIHWYKHI